MGVLTDYFRAPDAAVVRALELTGGGRPDFDDGSGAGFDGVEAKRIDPVVLLGLLVAAIRREEWQPGTVPEAPVWPTTPQPGPDGPGGEDDPWTTGPWVTELS